MTLNKLRANLKGNKFTNIFYNLLKYFYYHLYICMHKGAYKKVNKKLSVLQINSILDTVHQLIHSNKSLGRFGDGELSWILNESTGINEFEKPSISLRHNLLRVLESNNDNFMVGLPDSFRSLNNLKEFPKDYWFKYITNEVPKFIKYLNSGYTFYNTEVTRPYMDYDNEKDSGLIFYLLKQIWKNKKILIIEGCKSRVGIKDDLLHDAELVKRIECPATNAFESYHKILKVSSDFLNYHKDFITLISLGPTATILAYDLFNKGYRAIDIGHIDVEYDWYLLGATHKVNLPYHYVNEAVNGSKVKSINSNSYNKEIVSIIKR